MTSECHQGLAGEGVGRRPHTAQGKENGPRPRPSTVVSVADRWERRKNAAGRARFADCAAELADLREQPLCENPTCGLAVTL